MMRSLKMWGMAFAVVATLVAGPRTATACLSPLPTNVGIALSTTSINVSIIFPNVAL